MTRVAAVDLGTNSTRLLVADVEDGAVEEVVRRTVVTRLGEGVDARRRLLPVPVIALSQVAPNDINNMATVTTLAIGTAAEINASSCP